MSRRIAVCAVSLFVVGATLLPSTSSAQTSPASRFAIEPMSWLSALWEQVIDRIVPLSEAGIQIDGNGINAEAGIQIDGNGRTAPTNDN